MSIKKVILVIVFLALIAMACAYGLYRNRSIIKHPEAYSFNVNLASQLVSEDYKLAQTSNALNSIFMELKYIEAKYNTRNDDNSQRVKAFDYRMLEVYQNTLTSRKPESNSKIFSNEDLIFLSNNEKILLHQANNFICFPKIENYIMLKKESNIRKDALFAVKEDLKKKNINADIISFGYDDLFSPTEDNKEFQKELEKILSDPDISQNNEKLQKFTQIDRNNVEEVRKLFNSTRDIFWKKVENLDVKWRHKYIIVAKDNEKVYVYRIYPYDEARKLYWDIESQSILNKPASD